MKKIILFASGRGSNAEAIFRQSNELGFEISAIVCDKPEALVLKKSETRDGNTSTFLFANVFIYSWISFLVS